MLKFIKSIWRFIKIFIFGKNKPKLRYLFWSSADDNIYLGDKLMEAQDVSDLIECGHLYYCDSCQSYVTELSEDEVDIFLVAHSSGVKK